MSNKYFQEDLLPVMPEMEVSSEGYHLGERPDIEVGKITVRIAEFPEIVNYYHLLQKNNTELPKEITQLVERFDLYLLTHSIGIVDNSKLSKVVQLGYRLKPANDARLQNRALFPETAFVKPNVSGGFTFSAALNTKGELGFPSLELPAGNTGLTLSTEAGVKATLSSDFSIHLSFPTLSPVIQVIGKYSSYAEWSISLDEKPLVGDQLFFQLAVVEKGLDFPKLKAQVYASILTSGLFISRRESNWLELHLPNS